MYDTYHYDIFLQITAVMQYHMITILRHTSGTNQGSAQQKMPYIQYICFIGSYTVAFGTSNIVMDTGRAVRSTTSHGRIN